MYQKTFDYYTPEEELLNKIEAQLAARTPEEIARDNDKAMQSFEEVLQKYEAYATTHFKVPNQKKHDDFLRIAELVRKYTASHCGKISISAEEGGLGIIKMYFRQIFHTQTDSSHSRLLFGLLFQKFEDIFISPHDGGVSIEIYQELYDIERTEAPETARSPKRAHT